MSVCRFNLLNLRQNTVIEYLGATSAGVGAVSGFTVLQGKLLASATVVQANPFEPTQVPN